MNKKRIVIGASIAILIFLVFAVTYAMLNRGVGTGVNIVVIPADSKITMDGKVVSSGDNNAKPGNHTIEVSHKDFDVNKKIVEVSNDQVTLVAIGLSPSNSAGEKWVKDNQKAYLELENTANQETQQNSIEIQKTYPIITSLPQDISPLFRIDYGVSKRHPKDKTKIALYISSDTPANKYDAIRYIYSMGYDPSDYEIIFEGL
jgi:hypothetical protein